MDTGEVINYSRYNEFVKTIEPFFDSIENHHLENQKLEELIGLLLARMTKVN